MSCAPLKTFGRLWSSVALLVVGAATFAAAQTPPGVLNKLELQKLVAAETPIANLRLVLHFNTLADRYVNEAARHRAMAVVFRATANRSASTNAASPYEQRAARAEDWAAAARALARYHADLAAGREPVVPRGAAELQAGRGAPEPTADQLHKLALTARTRVDHLALAEYYAITAGKRLAEADHYVRIATGYRAGVRQGIYDPAANYERLAERARKAATKAKEAATRHTQLATVA